MLLIILIAYELYTTDVRYRDMKVKLRAKHQGKGSIPLLGITSVNISHS